MNMIQEMVFIDWLEKEAEELAVKADKLSKQPPSNENNILMSHYTGTMEGYAKCIEKFLEFKQEEIVRQN